MSAITLSFCVCVCGDLSKRECVFVCFNTVSLPLQCKALCVCAFVCVFDVIQQDLVCMMFNWCVYALILCLSCCSNAVNVFKCFHVYICRYMYVCVRVILTHFLFLSLYLCSVEIFSEWAEESMRICVADCLSTRLTSLMVCQA